MKKDDVTAAAERFADLLIFAEEPEIRCHPDQVKTATLIFEAILKARKALWKKVPLKLIVDDFVPADRIYAIDAAELRRRPVK